MSTGINVCKDCTDRHLGCHSDCKKYLSSKEKYESNKAEIRRQKALNSQYDGFMKEQSIRRERRCR